MAKIIGIYKITSPTGKVYIGQSIDIIRRKRFYKSLRCKEQPIVYRSLLKYGWHKHKFEILCECSREDLNNMEKYYVDLYQTFNSKFGMNLLDGGGSKAICSESTKLKMSIARRGMKFSEEHKKKISESNKNKIRSKEWCKNISIGKKNPSKETRMKIALRSKGNKNMLGKKHSNETKEKISKANTGRIPYNRRPVIDIDTNIIYPCKRIASIALGINLRTLKAKLEGKLKNNTSLRYV